MQAKLTAIGLGALLACACSIAAAQTISTVSITQEGNRNSAYSEQVDTQGPGQSATIIQIGNNNHAGDPRTRTGGIFQSAGAEARAVIYQVGNGNEAGIDQEATQFPVLARIDQLGNRNTGYIAQYIQTFSDGTLSQTGNDNVAFLEQSGVADSGFRAIQNGSGNFLSFIQSEGQFVPPLITQTGDGNSIRVDQDGPILSTSIDQNGSMNTVTSTMRDVSDGINSILQIGDGNTAHTNQRSGANNASVIVQAGNDNWAKLTQIGSANTSLIAQTGDNNRARVRQVGDGYDAVINQTGNGNNARIFQH